MRRLLCWILLGLAGCARAPREPWTQGAPGGQKSSSVIVTPAQPNRGRILTVNSTAKHVVVTYPIGVPLPLVEQRLNVYRAGLKVAEIRVSKERMDVNVVADIASGECKPGDEVRED
jgi:hypothetical protein